MRRPTEHTGSDDQVRGVPVAKASGSTTRSGLRRDRMVVDLTNSEFSLTFIGGRRSSLLYRLAKRAMDVVVALILLVGLSPLLVGIALAVKYSSGGPVLFRQERVGRWGDRFFLLKFRTMYQHADEAFHRQHREDLASGNGSSLLIQEDPRVTPLGKSLRKWSLDELPNLWNVLRGELSLVGPRPLVPYELLLHDPIHLQRLEVPPGITGLAQVEGRLEVALEERARWDLEYVAQRSFWLDLKILVRTPSALIRRPGA